MNDLSLIHYYPIITRVGACFPPSIRPGTYCVHTINGPPPCPLNILENDWNEALDELCKNITLELWCEAASCGFSKTNMGHSTGWLWHAALIEKFNLQELEPVVYRALVRVLHVLWNEFQLLYGVPGNDYDSDEWVDINVDKAALRYLLTHYPDNTLIKFVDDTYHDYNYDYEYYEEDGYNFRTWSVQASLTCLVKRIRNDFPILANVECLHKKIKSFMRHYIIRKQNEINELIYISEPIIKQIEADLFQHMKGANRHHPYQDMENIIKEWDEMAAAYAVCSDLVDNDVLSTFVAFCKFADYS